MSRTSNTLTVLLALSVIASWGFSFIAIEIALRELTPLQLVTLRFLPAAAIFAFILPRLIRGPNRPTGSELLGLGVTGLFAVIVYNIALNTGQTHLPASLAALVIALNPASIALTASIWLGERPPMRTWLGLVVALLGVVLVVFARHGSPEIRAGYLTGVLITLGAPLSWGIFTTGLRRSVKRMGARNATATAVLLGSLPLLFTINAELVSVVRNASLETILAILFLSLICTVYGFTMWAVVLKRFEAARAGAFIYLVPLIAAAGSHLVLAEPIDMPLIGGGVIVIFGVALATGRFSRLLRRH